MTAGWRAGCAYWLTTYRRLWRATLFSSFVEPVLFLAAMGLGLGGYVHHHASPGQPAGYVDGVRYIAFIAPGLLAASGMQTGMGESAWPVMGAVKWTGTYKAMVATPLSPRDAFAGHYVYMLLRVAMTAAVFSLVIIAFGLAQSVPGVLLSWLGAVLTGAAFSGCIAAFSVGQDQDSRLSLLYRFGLMPMFLFSGTFFPVSQLPAVLRPVAWITPLWHGVAFCRGTALGTAGAGSLLGHAAYLVVMAAVGCLLAARAYRKRLTW